MAGPSRKKVSADLAAESSLVRALGAESLRDGTWFRVLLGKVLKSFVAKATREELLRRYAGVNEEDVVKHLIGETANATALAAVVAAAGTDVALIAGLPSGGATIPAGAAAAMGEILYTTKAQVRLVVNIATLNGRRLDPDEPAQVIFVLGVALGVESGKLAKKVLAQAGRAAFEKLSLKVGSKILIDGIKKYVVPGANIVIGGGVNWVTTRAVGTAARDHFRGEEEERELDRIRRASSIVLDAARSIKTDFD